MRNTGPIAIVATTALVFALAGCSGGFFGTSDGELSSEDSPLSEYLTPATGGDLSDDAQQTKIDEQQRKHEEFVAACMADEGFEYTPNPPVNMAEIGGEDGETGDPESREWVEKHGYGLLGIGDMHDAGAGSGEQEVIDPNQEYVTSLSESEQAAYNESLYGPLVATDGEASDEYDWKNGGCIGSALHELQGDDPWQGEEFAELRDKLDEFWRSLEGSSAFSELDAKWAACMKDAGEPGFAAQADAQRSIDEEFTALTSGDAAGADEGEFDPEAFDTLMSSPEVKKLHEREIELALVDLTCREKVSYREKSLEIQFAQEEQFIADNKADLEAFKAAAEQGE